MNYIFGLICILVSPVVLLGHLVVFYVGRIVRRWKFDVFGKKVSYAF